MVLTQVPGKKKNETESSSASSAFLPAESDKFTLFVALSKTELDDPYSYFLLSFDGGERKVSVTRLFSETVLSAPDEEKIILGEQYKKGGAAYCMQALGEFFKTDISKYILFDNKTATGFFELFDPTVINVPQNLSKTDSENDIFIKIDKGRQMLGASALLDYIGFTEWSGGETQTLKQSADAICDFIRQNHAALSLCASDECERYILEKAKSNLSVVDIEKRRELMKYLLFESGDSVLLVAADGNYGAAGTEFILSAASAVRIADAVR